MKRIFTKLNEITDIIIQVRNGSLSKTQAKKQIKTLGRDPFQIKF